MRNFFHWWLAQRFGAIIPTATKAAVPAMIEKLQATYTNPNLKFESLNYPTGDKAPYIAWFTDAAHHSLGVVINPYTGKIMGDYEWDKTWHGILLHLHYSLLAGETGILVMGVVALLTVILGITGIILWPGWRKLSAGFKIKWNGHIKRTNFDIHKVAGIVTAVFLVLTGFTGFAWNVPQAHIEEAIYALTFTPKLSEPVSKPIPNQKPLPFKDLLQRADAIFPNAKITSIDLAHQPEGIFIVGKKQAGETIPWGSTSIAFDRFSGEVVQLEDGMKPSRAKAILNQFTPLHYGTFAGIYSQILYFFVGLTPTILLVTGFIMWWHRKKRTPSKTNPKRLQELTKS
ncbi:MAG: PepSY domain-containing protein [Acaryochloris sp. RU_4_1]|nr:PepSY domain-containing protein [Acaryochloris sp. RU_4_1]